MASKANKRQIGDSMVSVAMDWLCWCFVGVRLGVKCGREWKKEKCGVLMRREKVAAVPGEI